MKGTNRRDWRFWLLGGSAAVGVALGVVTVSLYRRPFWLYAAVGVWVAVSAVAAWCCDRVTEADLWEMSRERLEEQYARLAERIEEAVSSRRSLNSFGQAAVFELRRLDEKRQRIEMRRATVRYIYFERFGEPIPDGGRPLPEGRYALN